MPKTRDYEAKRSFDATPEPPPEVAGDVDLARAVPGDFFMIHQHHATRLHFDLRLQFFNGKTPVLVSWAVPKNLPLKKGKPHLAIHVEDHPWDYRTFSGTIPAGNYGAGEVRIFDEGTYEVTEQEPGKLSIRLHGNRLAGEWHMVRTSKDDGKDEWLVFLRSDDRPEPQPRPDLAPMLATLGRDPFDDDRYMFEPKWDGIRTLSLCTDATRMYSRTGREITETYPELDRLHQRLVAVDAIVDGEIVAMEKGRPSFEKLQSRINVQNPREIKRLMTTIPVTIVLFDLLYLDGRRICDLPIEERKELLDDLVVPAENVQVSPHLIGEGIALAEAAAAKNLEGIVAKRLGSTYRPGKRAKEWIKIKVVHEADLVIGGWTRGEGSRSNSFGALLVGAHTDDGLLFLGAVGTGFSEKTIDALVPQLKELASDECPFVDDPTGTGGRFGKPIKNPSWLRPELVAKVEFRELTAGHRLRAPSFKGLHPDKNADECSFKDVAEIAGWDE